MDRWNDTLCGQTILIFCNISISYKSILSRNYFIPLFPESHPGALFRHLKQLISYSHFYVESFVFSSIIFDTQLPFDSNIWEIHFLCVWLGCSIVYEFDLGMYTWQEMEGLFCAIFLCIAISELILPCKTVTQMFETR